MIAYPKTVSFTLCHIHTRIAHFFSFNLFSQFTKVISVMTVSLIIYYYVWLKNCDKRTQCYTVRFIPHNIDDGV